MSFAKRLEEAQRAAQVKAVGGEEAYAQYKAKKRRTEIIASLLASVVTMALSFAVASLVAWGIRVCWNAVATDLGAPQLSFYACLGIVGLLTLASMFFKRSKK